MSAGSSTTQSASQTAKAIAAITARQQQTLTIPEIDFTQHQLDSGEVVLTNERVVKDVSLVLLVGVCGEGGEDLFWLVGLG